MRATVILLCLFLSITSCNNSTKNNDPDADPSQNINQNKDQNSDQNIDTMTQDDSSNDPEEDQDGGLQSANSGESKSGISNISGTYINTEHTEDTDCACFCIEVTTGTSELCLRENDLFITARFQQKGDNIEIYYNGKSSRTSNKDIPWSKFETGTPIAVLSPASDNSIKLDWKGFSIDGKIAVDYALYGKKTLEGIYKKK